MAEAGWLAPYVAILLGAALPTHVWRWLGVLLAGRIDEQSETFTFVRAVATAMVAALVSRLVLFADGPLADVPAILRVAAMGAGFAAYFASGQRLVVGVLAAEVFLVAAYFLTVD